MSSPTPFAASPTSSPSHDPIPKSRYTYKHLSQLKTFSPTTPLRPIAHIDLDCFYAQCETVRLGLDPGIPLAVQQWQSLIAVNYPARPSGVSRHITATEALKLCPELRLQHVATWREGEEGWAYREDAARCIATDKVSLDPYRMASRRILACIKGVLPDKEQRVEKASIDEVFLDLSAQVHGVLMERFPELRGGRSLDGDANELLPKVPTTVVDWAADEVVGTGDEEGEEEDTDWDDVCLAIAAEIVRDVRREIKEKLGYTCSGGVAKNKLLAKLGSAYKKPNQQTVIRNRAVGQFLSEKKFTKIRMLGGKLGDEVVAMFGTDLVKDLLDKPLEQLKRLGDDTGTWLYGTIRGEDHSEVNPRTQLKSMLSAKSFRPAINSFEQGVRWLKIFAADIFSRCVEEGVLENKRRPKTINLHHRQGAQTRSRQSPIPQGKPLSEALLFDLAKNLLAQVVVDGRAWPCANLSLSVGGWEDGVTNNQGISGFLVRGAEAKALSTTGKSSGQVGEPPRKRRRKGNIANFFGPRDEKKQDFDAARAVLLAHRRSTNDDEEEDDEDLRAQHGEEDVFEERERSTTPHLGRQSSSDLHNEEVRPSAQRVSYAEDKPISHQQSSNTFFCPRCNIHLPGAEKPEHDDFHFALDLSKEMRQEERITQRTPVPQKPTRGRGRPPGRGRGGAGSGSGNGKEQARLAFGRPG